MIEEVSKSLQSSIKIAEERGVKHIVTDVVFGFGKDVNENLCLVNEMGQFLKLNRPTLVGLSNKSSVGAVLSGQALKPVASSQRIFGGLGVTAVAVMAGASIVRAHNVRETVDV